jgi:hypothetical protein
MEEPKLTWKKFFGHWKTVRTHRKWVRYYCHLAGITWRGIKHDLSKYSPIEFLESARFWTGDESPIHAAKRFYGYSRAWLHHRGRNPHHWAYWADNFSEGLKVYCMPCNDFVELVCDFLAAGRAYSGDCFSYSGERAWWLKDRERGNSGMNPKNKLMLDIILSDLEFAENHSLAGCPTSLITSTPESLIKSGYLQEVWRANK